MEQQSQESLMERRIREAAERERREMEQREAEKSGVARKIVEESHAGMTAAVEEELRRKGLLPK